METITLRQADGRVACQRCAVANRPWTRLRGLLGRSGLGADQGMLFPRTGSIHTMFMRFAIDVVFLDGEMRVLSVREAVPAWRAVKQRGAKATLELSRGRSVARRNRPRRPPAPHGDHLHLVSRRRREDRGSTEVRGSEPRASSRRLDEVRAVITAVR